MYRIALLGVRNKVYLLLKSVSKVQISLGPVCQFSLLGPFHFLFPSLTTAQVYNYSCIALNPRRLISIIQYTINRMSTKIQT